MESRRVPWINHQELVQVHQWLYSRSKVDAQRGVDRVTWSLEIWHFGFWIADQPQVGAWLCRGRVPRAIESTADLVTAQLQDAQNSITPLAMQHLYGMAIVRCFLYHGPLFTDCFLKFKSNLQGSWTAWQIRNRKASMWSLYLWSRKGWVSRIGWSNYAIEVRMMFSRPWRYCGKVAASWVSWGGSFGLGKELIRFLPGTWMVERILLEYSNKARRIGQITTAWGAAPEGRVKWL